MMRRARATRCFTSGMPVNGTLALLAGVTFLRLGRLRFLPHQAPGR